MSKTSSQMASRNLRRTLQIALIWIPIVVYQLMYRLRLFYNRVTMAESSTPYPEGKDLELEDPTMSAEMFDVAGFKPRIENDGAAAGSETKFTRDVGCQTEPVFPDDAANSLGERRKTESSSNTDGGSYTKPVSLSPELAALVGGNTIPSHEDGVAKKIWTVYKERNLQNTPSAIRDDELSRVPGVTSFRTYGIMKLMESRFRQ